MPTYKWTNSKGNHDLLFITNNNLKSIIKPLAVTTTLKTAVLGSCIVRHIRSRPVTHSN